MDPLKLTLEEVITMKKKESKINKQMIEDLSLDEIVEKMKRNSTLSKVSEVTSCDIDKSLDDIIKQKQIVPSSSSPQTLAQMTITERRPGNVVSVSRRSKNPVIKINIRPLDPYKTALDDIIEDVTSEEGNVDESSSQDTSLKLKRKIDTTDDSGSSEVMKFDPKTKWRGNQRQYPNVTPYRAVGFLNKQGMIIEVKTGRLADDTGDRTHLWRCIVTCGGIEGIADSIRKVVAREMASEQFLINLRQMYEGCEIPKYEILDELFIDPRIYHKLEREAGQLGRFVGYETMIREAKPIDGNSLLRQPYYTYVCNYLVGNEEFEGENFVLEYAKLIAARKAYVALTGKNVTPTRYFVGANCDTALQFDFSESEVYQTVSRTEDTGRDSIPEEPEEVKIEMTRRAIYEKAKKARLEEVERRRNMPVDVDVMHSRSNEDTNIIGSIISLPHEPTEMEVDKISEIDKPVNWQSKGRGRGSIRGKADRN